MKNNTSTCIIELKEDEKKLLINLALNLKISPSKYPNTYCENAKKLSENIPIRIKNTFSPDQHGSVIIPNGYITPSNSTDQIDITLKKHPTAVTIKEGVVVVNILSNRKSVSHGFFEKIFSTLDQHGIKQIAVLCQTLLNPPKKPVGNKQGHLLQHHALMPGWTTANLRNLHPSGNWNDALSTPLSVSPICNTFLAPNRIQTEMGASGTSINQLQVGINPYTTEAVKGRLAGIEPASLLAYKASPLILVPN